MSNLKKKIITLTTLACIKKIKAPLQQFGIDHFTHDITFGKDKLTMLTDDEEVFDVYYNQQAPVICTNEFGRTLEPGIYLMRNLFHNNNCIKDILSILNHKYNFQNSLIFIENEVDCQHMFTLNSFLEEHIFLHTILNNLDNIKNFLNFYKLSLKDIIIEAKKPKHQISFINSTDFEKNNLDNFSSILTKLKSNGQLKLKPRNTNQYINLSMRQRECLTLLLKSYSAKEIAKEMHLSYRTIEHYIEHLKSRLNCRSTKELIISYCSKIDLA